jgi:hypothetical protein
MRGFVEITHVRVSPILIFVNSKLKFNGMNDVEGKFKNAVSGSQKNEDPRVTPTRGARKFIF